MNETQLTVCNQMYVGIYISREYNTQLTRANSSASLIALSVMLYSVNTFVYHENGYNEHTLNGRRMFDDLLRKNNPIIHYFSEISSIYVAHAIEALKRIIVPHFCKMFR